MSGKLALAGAVGCREGGRRTHRKQRPLYNSENRRRILHGRRKGAVRIGLIWRKSRTHLPSRRNKASWSRVRSGGMKLRLRRFLSNISGVSTLCVCA